MGIDSEMESRWQLVEEWGKGREGLSKKEKELMDMDNGVVIAVGRVYKGTKC